MSLLRFLLLLLIFYILFAALKSFIRARKRKMSPPDQLGEPMVLDPQCQTYVPKSDAIEREGKFFCSEECATRYLTG